MQVPDPSLDLPRHRLGAQSLEENLWELEAKEQQAEAGQSSAQGKREGRPLLDAADRALEGEGEGVGGSLVWLAVLALVGRPRWGCPKADTGGRVPRCPLLWSGGPPSLSLKRSLPLLYGSCFIPRPLLSPPPVEALGRDYQDSDSDSPQDPEAHFKEEASERTLTLTLTFAAGGWRVTVRECCHPRPPSAEALVVGRGSGPCPASPPLPKNKKM